MSLSRRSGLLVLLLGSTAYAQLVLPYQGTTTTSNPNGSAFSVANNTNFTGTSYGIRSEALNNASGPAIGIYARGKDVGIDVGVASPLGYGIASSCTSTGVDSCISIYSINPVGTGPAAMAGYFSSPGTGIYANGGYSTSTALRAVADPIGAVAANVSSKNGVALRVSTVSGQAAYIYSSSTSSPAATIESAQVQPAVVATNSSTTGGTNGDAIFAQSQAGDGVEARCSASNCQNGVYGFSGNPNASCVIGQSSSGVQGYGVVGRSWGAGHGVYGDLVSPTSGYAGYFQGRTHINGTLSKLSGTFKIDHPQDPANKYLVHSFVESPEMKNIYDGLVTLGPDGTATVRLPSYFESLNESFRYQLTPIGAPASLYVKSEISGGAFVVAGGSAGLRVSWQVSGTRKDSWAKAHPIVVEEEKSATERGRYLTPEFMGAGARAMVSGPSFALPRDPEPARPPPDFSRPVIVPPRALE